MHIKHIEIVNFRNPRAVRIDVAEMKTVFIGPTTAARSRPWSPCVNSWSTLVSVAAMTRTRRLWLYLTYPAPATTIAKYIF